MKIYYIIMLSVLFIIIVVVNKLLKKFEKPIKKNVIKQPFSKFNQDITTTIMFVFFGIWMIVVQAPPIYVILFFVLAVIYILQIIYYKNWKIEFNSSKLLFTNFFNVKKEYDYKDIEVKELKSGLILYSNGFKITKINYTCDNSKRFLRVYKNWQSTLNSKTSEKNI